MSVDPTELEAIEEALHQASLDPWRWAAALRRVSGYVAGAGALAALTFIDGEAATSGWLLHGAEEGEERPVAFDERGGHALFARSLSLPEGHVGPSEAFAAPRDLAATTLARVWLADDGTLRGVSAMVTSEPSLVASLHVLTRSGDPGWRAGAEARLRSVVAPMRRAVRVYVRLRRAREHAAVDRALLDLVDVAAMLVDARGSALRLNPSAQALLARCDGVKLEGGRVRCVRESVDETFRSALAEASMDEAPTARVVVVARASGRRPLLLFLSGVRTGGAEGPCAVAVLARDSDARGPHTEDILKMLFGLTPAEVRLCLAIAEGNSPAEAADVLGRSVETVRTHLKRVFEKTATTRQSELVRLVLAELPPAGGR